MPSLHESVPGQLTVSVISSAPASPRPELVQPVPHLVHRLVADPPEHEVLVHRGAGGSAGVLAHDLSDPAELLRRQVPPRHLDLDRVEPGLALGLHVGGEEVLELMHIAVGSGVGVAGLRSVRLLVVLVEDLLEREVTRGHPVALELLLHLLAEGVDADLVDQHLDPSPGPVDPQPVLAVEDPHAGLGDLEVVAVVELDELVQRRGETGHDRGPTADPHLDASHAVLIHARQEGHVVDPGDRVVLVGRRERRLDLARHRLRRGMTDEVADIGAGVGGDVEQLALERPGARIAGDVAHRVAAAFA